MNKNSLVKTNIFICLIIIFGFVVTSLISYHSNRGIFRQDVEHISTLTSEGIYHQIDSIFTKPINVSLTMANDSLLKEFLTEEEQKGDDEEFIQTMRNYLFGYKEKYNYDSVFLVSAATNKYYHFDKGVDRVLVDGNLENVWYYTFLNAPDEYSLNIDNDEVEGANNEITIFVNCKIKDEDGSVMGVVGVGFRVNYLQAMFGDYEKKFGLKAYLVNDDGTIQISTEQTGYQKADLFVDCGYEGLKNDILSEKGVKQCFWYCSGEHRGYLVTQYVSNLEWYLVIDNNTTGLEKKLNHQFILGMLIIVLVIAAVLVVITNIIRKYNRQIVKLTVESEKRHRSVFQMETEKIYENIYELDITHNRAASEETESYFKSLGVPEDTPFDMALAIIAKTQIKEEYRQGYIDTFTPKHVMRAYERGEDKLCYDFMISNDQGKTYYWMRITARIFYWEDDKSVRMFVYRQNIDEEKQHEKHLVEKMEQDSLTRLFNKAATQEHIQRLLKESPGKTFAFFILDIDNFKQVNDTLGHSVGDQVISEFANLLKEQFHSFDIVGRIGGDEFAVFVPVSSKEWVEEKVQKLSETLHHDFVDGDVRYGISASIGVAVAPEAGEDFESLYKNADSALYHTKENGKDGYTIFEGAG